MKNGNITFSNALDSLNRIDEMMDDLLRYLQEWENFQKKGNIINSMLSDFERNIKGDEDINVYGLDEVADFIVNESNKTPNSKQYNVEPLISIVLRIGEKNAKADELLFSFPEMWNPSFPFLGTLSKLSFDIYHVSKVIRYIRDGVNNNVNQNKRGETSLLMVDDVPDVIIDIFGGTKDEYDKNMNKLRLCNSTKQIVAELLSIRIDGETMKLYDQTLYVYWYKHLYEMGIIKIKEDSFRRAINKQSPNNRKK